MEGDFTFLIKMKKKFLVIGILSLILFLGNFRLAYGELIKPPIPAGSFEELINSIINFLFYLAFAVAPIMIIYAGFLMMTAGGSPEQLKRAKTIILWTLVALAIILLAKGLPSLIKGALGG